MVTAEPAEHAGMDAVDHRLPPVTELAVGTLVLIIVGGIDVAARLPQQAALWLPIVLLVAAVVLLIANVVVLSRVQAFAWHTFFLVVRYAVLAYIVIAGMLEFVFVLDGTPSRLLALLTAMLVVFAVDIPLLFGFSVARYQPVDRAD